VSEWSWTAKSSNESTRWCHFNTQNSLISERIFDFLRRIPFNLLSRISSLGFRCLNMQRNLSIKEIRSRGKVVGIFALDYWRNRFLSILGDCYITWSHGRSKTQSVQYFPKLQTSLFSLLSFSAMMIDMNTMKMWQPLSNSRNIKKRCNPKITFAGNSSARTPEDNDISGMFRIYILSEPF